MLLTRLAFSVSLKTPTKGKHVEKKYPHQFSESDVPKVKCETLLDDLFTETIFFCASQLHQLIYPEYMSSSFYQHRRPVFLSL
jgi:hypothetical protein